VTLSRNQGKFLQEALDSILAQSPPVDYLVYDVASTDNTVAILKKMKGKEFRILEVEKDGGPSDGLNRGLSIVQGEIFYYLNADDRVMPGAFEYVRNYFEQNPTCDVLHGSIVLIDKSGNRFKTLPAIKFSLKGYAHRYSVVYQQATFIRKRVLTEQPFKVCNKTSWDGELMVDLALQGCSIHRTLYTLGEFRIHDDSITGSGRLNYETTLDHKRIFKEIKGREWYFLDDIYSWVLRKFFAILRRLFVHTKTLPKGGIKSGVLSKNDENEQNA